MIITEVCVGHDSEIYKNMKVFNYVVTWQIKFLFEVK